MLIEREENGLREVERWKGKNIKLFRSKKALEEKQSWRKKRCIETNSWNTCLFKFKP